MTPQQFADSLIAPNRQVSFDKDELKDIRGYEGLYAITRGGRVWSYPKTWFTKVNNKTWSHSGKWMTPVYRLGYWCINLSKEGTYVPFRINRLVAQAFIPNLDNKPEVNHKDGNSLNNHYTNLEWCTRSENEIHAYKNGLINHVHGERSKSSKLTELQVREIRQRYVSHSASMRSMCKEYKISRDSISDVIHNRTWRHVI